MRPTYVKETDIAGARRGRRSRVTNKNLDANVSIVERIEESHPRH